MSINAQAIAERQGRADFCQQVDLIKQPLDVSGTFDTRLELAV